MKKLFISKKLICFLILSIVYCILIQGHKFTVALPLVLIAFQFTDGLREKKFFPLLLIVVFIATMIFYVVTAIKAFSEPAYLSACASVLIHTMLFNKTFDIMERDNEFDFNDYPVKTVFYFIGVFGLPLIVQYVILPLGSSIATVLSWIFLVSAILTLISPILLIRSLLSESGFSSGAYAKTGGLNEVEKVAKKVARDMNFKFVNARSVAGGYEITINTCANSFDVQKGLAQQYADALEANGMDMSKISIKY